MDFKTLLKLKSFDDLMTEAKNRLLAQKSKITNWNVGGVFRTLTALAMQALADLYALILLVAPQGFLATATGPWLDIHARAEGVFRLQASKTYGVVRFSRTDSGQVVRIPQGTILKTDMDARGHQLRFFASAECVLQKDSLYIDVPVIAEFDGAEYNVGEGYIRNIVTHVPGIDAATNLADWITSEGTDQEADEPLRERCYLRWDELGTGAPARAYISWARSIQGVTDATCDDEFPRGPGTVDVIITSPIGAPTQELLDKVKAYVDTKRPNCSDTLIKPPTLVTVDHDIVLYALQNIGEDAAMITETEAIIQAMFIQDKQRPTISPYRIGTDVIQNRYIAYLMNVKNAVNVKVNSPATDIPIGLEGIAIQGNCTIQVQRVDAI